MTTELTQKFLQHLRAELITGDTSGEITALTCQMFQRRLGLDLAKALGPLRMQFISGANQFRVWVLLETDWLPPPGTTSEIASAARAVTGTEFVGISCDRESLQLCYRGGLWCYEWKGEAR
jgi:hypothetical protein